MVFLPFLAEAGWGCFKNIALMMAIIIPLMIVIEIFQERDILNRMMAVMNPITRFMGMSRESNLPLLAGMVFGISYGAGVIINCTRAGTIRNEEIFTINLFLIICHSIFEDTLLFAAIGAKWIPLLLGRFVLAVIVCAVWVRVFHRLSHPLT
ncbi:MAG: nucleoside recognition domain-containing protein [Syntrophomonadaceae bacterium]|nr:nucleoside recognition domain-containing protein [Syntrophomonadaceae bacterium]